MAIIETWNQLYPYDEFPGDEAGLHRIAAELKFMRESVDIPNRPAIEIQKAHDLIASILLSRVMTSRLEQVLIRMSGGDVQAVEDAMKALRPAQDALCWILGHDSPLGPVLKIIEDHMNAWGAVRVPLGPTGKCSNPAPN